MTDRTPFNPLYHGQLNELEDGRVSVVFERQFAHSIEKVWRAISDPDELAHWFPGIKLDQKVGGSFKIWFGEGCEGPAHVEGQVTAYDPPNLLQLGGMRYELTANKDGCLLRFSDILMFDEIRTRQLFALSVLGGWHNYMDMLGDALNGKEVLEKPELDYSTVQVPGWKFL